MFPFEVPADLSAATTEELSTLLDQIRAFAASLTAEDQTVTSEVLDGLRASRDLAAATTAEITGREERNAEAASILSDLAPATFTTDNTETDDETSDDAVVDDDGSTAASAAVTAAARRKAPGVRDVAKRGTTPQLPDATRQRYATMKAAADVPGFAAGKNMETFAEAAQALDARLGQYPTDSGRYSKPSGKPLVVNTDGGRRYEMRSFSRHGAVQFKRQFPKDLTVDEGVGGLAVAEFAANERRLPGGSLVKSAQKAVADGRSLTAAAGWCAPSETIWDLCELETLDGLLDMPELTTTRGGWQIPANGGPNFATIWTGLGTTHRTEAEVIAESPSKSCYEIPCHGFTDVRLGVDYFCLTASLLQRRGYPEVVARFGRGALTALAHKINMGVITAVAAAAGAATVIPAGFACADDAISSLLSGVDLAIVDAKYRNRLGFGSTLEVVLPWWVLAQIRAAGTRRSGVDMVGITDAMIMDWFAMRGAVPRFVYDWQDSFAGLATGPGGAVALTALPTTVNFLIYPAGTFVKAVQPVVNLDTVYDSTRLGTNEYTAVFVEDGWAVLQMCPFVRQYTSQVDPCGDIGCCPVS
jgi:hypothetical protein